MDNKPWYQSSGVVGALVALAALAGNSIGQVVISADDVKAALDLFAREMELVGAVMALIGRIKATRTIGANPSTIKSTVERVATRRRDVPPLDSVV